MSRHGFQPREDRELFELDFTIRPEDIDANGHVNNVVYVRWVQDAGIAHWDARFSEEERAKWSWVAVRHEIDYRRQLLLGEPVHIRTWVGDVEGAKFPRYVLIEGPNGLCAQGKTDWALVDSTTFRPSRIPPWMIERLAARG